MPVGESQPSQRRQTSLHKYWPPANYDAIALLRSRGRQEAERRRASLKSSEADTRTTVTLQHAGPASGAKNEPLTAVITPVARKPNSQTSSSTVHTPPTKANRSPNLLPTANASVVVDPICPSAKPEMKRKISVASVSADDARTPRSSKRSRNNSPDLDHKPPSSSISTSVSPAHTPRRRTPSSLTKPLGGPPSYQRTRSSSSNLSPPPSQLSIPSDLKRSLPSPSQEQAKYVPSSQSDENEDSDQLQPVQSEYTATLAGLDSSDSDSDFFLSPRRNLNRDHIGQANAEDKSLHLSTADGIDRVESDSDTSSSSLPDLQQMIAKHGATHELQNRGSTVKRKAAYSGSYNELRTFTPSSDKRPKVDGRFSLANLVKLHQQDLDAQAELSRAAAELDNIEREPDVSQVMNESVLASVVRQDEGQDEVTRLKRAMDHAEAANSVVAWHFFECSGDPGGLLEPPDPPKLYDKYQVLFEDRGAHINMFLSGLAGQLLSRSIVPEELQQWFWEAAASEPREDLADKYIRIMKVTKLKAPFGGDHIKQLFKKIGARPGSMQPEVVIDAFPQDNSAPKRQPPPHLSRILRMLTDLSHCLSLDARKYALDILLRLAVDVEISKDIEVQRSLQGSIVMLMETLPERNVADVLLSSRNNLQSLHSPTLQHGLLTSLPGTTPRVHYFRRHLAIYFFLRSIEPAKANLDDSPSSEQITEAIIATFKTNPALQTSSPDSTIDYRDFAALISILDIAIDNGFHPHKLHLKSTTPKTTTTNHSSLHSTTLTEQATINNPPEAESEENESAKAAASASTMTTSHNATIDTLSKHATLLAGYIQDAGGTDLHRTRAKAGLQRLVHRLEHAVRTEPRRETFWQLERAGDAGQRRLDAFVRRGKPPPVVLGAAAVGEEAARGLSSSAAPAEDAGDAAGSEGSGDARDGVQLEEGREEEADGGADDDDDEETFVTAHE